MTVNSALYAKKLTASGIRPSVQRMAIYEFIAENPVHPTAETVYLALADSYPTLSRTTVYNTLHLFAENKLLSQLTIENEEVRYDANTDFHIHFKCNKCKNIFDICENEKLNSLKGPIQQSVASGFICDHFEVNIWGTCPHCSD